MRAVILFVVALAGASHAGAQDLSGVWLVEEPGATFSTTPPPPMTPWAQERFAANKPTIGPHAALDSNDPTVECVPPGVPYVLVVPTPFEFVHPRDARAPILQLFEYSHFVRRIYMDGRPHPPDLQDTGTHEWLGHSIGRWDGDTLVVDTVGFNDRSWLDRLGRPHSDALHVVERIRREGETLRYEITVDDPKAYTAPWSGTMRFRRREGWTIGEHTCVSREPAEYQEYRDKAWRPAN